MNVDRKIELKRSSAQQWFFFIDRFTSIWTYIEPIGLLQRAGNLQNKNTLWHSAVRITRKYYAVSVANANVVVSAVLNVCKAFNWPHYCPLKCIMKMSIISFLSSHHQSHISRILFVIFATYQQRNCNADWMENNCRKLS